MDGPFRWVIAILIVAAIIALVVFARGEPEHGEPTAPPAAIQVVGSVRLMDEAPTTGRHISTQQAAFIGVAAMVGAGIFSLLGAAGEVAGRPSGCRSSSPAASPRCRATRSPSSVPSSRRPAACSSTSTRGSATATSRRWSPG